MVLTAANKEIRSQLVSQIILEISENVFSTKQAACHLRDECFW